MKKIVFLTGAGISAESGISTFRDANGLWEQYPVMDVCSADGFKRNPALVHQFYNERRRQLRTVKPNPAHCAIAQLAQRADVWVVTQNVDDLHERAGMPASRIIHLHGELTKVRSLTHPDRLFPMEGDTTPDTRIDGDPVRPHIVFFQEAVPMIEPAAEVVALADVLIIVGTSLAVFPAAGLVRYARPDAQIYYIDPNPAPVPSCIHVIAQKASTALPALLSTL